MIIVSRVRLLLADRVYSGVVKAMRLMACMGVLGSCGKGSEDVSKCEELGIGESSLQRSAPLVSEPSAGRVGGEGWAERDSSADLAEDGASACAEGSTGNARAGTV